MNAVAHPSPPTSERLFELCRTMGVSLPWSEETGVLGSPVLVGAHRAANRFVALPMEGCDGNPDGSPSDLTLRRYRRFAAGGAGIIWVEATAVTEDGRSNPRSLRISDHTLPSFRSLVEETRGEAIRSGCGNPILILQLTHAGRYSRDRNGRPAFRIAHHAPMLDHWFGVPDDAEVVDDDYLERLRDGYVQAALLAAGAGFDGVDVKCCHGYLLSELLAAHTRQGAFGGPFPNRCSFLLSTIAGIRTAAPDLIVAVRMNAYDGIPYPWGFGAAPVHGSVQLDLEEPKRLAEELAKRGVGLLSVTVGYPRFDPHYGRPSARYGSGPACEEHPLTGIERMLRCCARIQAATSIPVVTAGTAWLGTLTPNVAAGMIERGDAGFFGQGRGMFAYPDSVNNILSNGRMTREKCCVSCSLCSALMRKGGPTGCVVRDARYFRALAQCGSTGSAGPSR